MIYNIFITVSVLLNSVIKPKVGPSSGPAASGRVLDSGSRLVPLLVPVILSLALIWLLLLALVLVAVPALLRGGPALVGPLALLLGVKVVVRGEGVIQVVVVATVGAGMGLLLAGIQLQGAVPNAIAAIDQQA